MNIRSRYALFFIYSNYLIKFARDFIIPALPAITLSLQANATHIRLSVTAYFVGLLFSRFLWPPLADHGYPKQTMQITAGIFIVGTALCYTAQSVTMLLIARFLQGLCIGSLPAILRAQIHAATGREGTVKFLAHTSVITAWSSALATILGGYIVVHAGWRWQGSLLILITLVFLILLQYCFPKVNNTVTRDEPRQFWKPYKNILTNRDFYHYALPYGCLVGGSAVYFTQSSFIFIHGYQLSAVQYGYLTLALVIGLLLGKLSCAWSIKRFNAKHILQFASFLSCLASMSLWLLSLTSARHLTLILLAILGYFAGTGLLMPLTKTLVMEVNLKYRSTASGLIGVVSATLSAVASLLAAITPLGLSTMAILLFGLSSLSLITSLL